VSKIADSPRTIPIVVALIGVIGAVTPVLVTSFSSQSLNKPNVDINIIKSVDGWVELTLTNNGFAPATNLTLIVDASGEIANSSDYTLNTVQVSQIKIDDRRLEAHIPKLLQGSGSIVKLNISLSENSNNPYYVVYVTYDQGSNMKKYPATSTEALVEFSTTYGAFYIIFSVFYFPLILFYSYRRRRKRRRNLLISKVIEDIIEIRRVLRDNNTSTKVFSNNWKIETTPEKKVLRATSMKSGGSL
jgi:hypothetical protein